MIFVIGSVASGKRTFACGLGFADDEMALDVHEALRDDSIDPEQLADRFAALSVVTCAEVGSGIVPLDPAERAWRDRVGALSRMLAARADTVVRMVCGIPVFLKGDPLDSGPDHKTMGAPIRTTEGADVEFILIRHAQTPGNAQRRYVGSSIDQPLSDEGRAQAQMAGPHEEVERVYVSTLRRTCETAAIMFPNAEQVVVEGVHEMDFGEFAGRSADEMADDAAYRAWVEGECLGKCPGGESRAEFTDRVCDALAAFLREASERGERRVVMVAHGGTMMAFLDRYASDGRQYWEWLTSNCGGYRIGVSFDASSGDLVVRTVDLLSEGRGALQGGLMEGGV